MTDPSEIDILQARVRELEGIVEACVEIVDDKASAEIARYHTAKYDQALSAAERQEVMIRSTVGRDMAVRIGAEIRAARAAVRM